MLEPPIDRPARSLLAFFPIVVAVVVLACVVPLAARDHDWPQFRGRRGSGVADPDGALPASVGPAENVLWKTPLPPGHSSPVVWNDSLYLTAVRGKELLTIALDARTGAQLWEGVAPYRELETIHDIGSHAQPTPATDGERVYSFFGSAGLLAYDRGGKLLWHRPMGPFNDDYGAGSSPIVEGDAVLINQDHDTESFVEAIDKRSGASLWRTDRSEFVRSYSTPLVWEWSGQKDVVVLGTLRIAGYDLATGKERWTVRGFSRIANMTPALGGDGVLYAAGWAPGADPGERIAAPTFAEFASEHDKDASGSLERSEVPAAGPIGSRFRQIDRDKDGRITRLEYEGMRSIFEKSHNVLLAVRPGGQGDVTETHVLWKRDRMLPYVPSPLVYRGLVFMVKNGGIVSAIAANDGSPHKEGRVRGRANYYSSPVGGDGKVYLLSERGELSIITAEAEWREIHTADLAESAYATPAIAAGRIYLRTTGHLYCFGRRDGE